MFFNTFTIKIVYQKSILEGVLEDPGRRERIGRKWRVLSVANSIRCDENSSPSEFYDS